MREVSHGEIQPFARQDLVPSKSPWNSPSLSCEHTPDVNGSQTSKKILIRLC